jgi:ribose 5-phosphate isomerase A
MPSSEADSQKSAQDALATFKRQAGEYAVRYVHSNMRVGLGTGSTAIFAIRRIGELIASGELKGIVAFATSRASLEEAVRLKIPMMPEDLPEPIEVTIDGADEVDPQFNLIKGGGGALLREKLVAQNSAREIIVVDETKLSPKLGTRHALPVEVLPFGWRAQLRFVESLGAKVVVRQSPDGKEYRSDQGNMILDCEFGPIDDVHRLAGRLEGRAGILAHGLFLGLAQTVIVAGPTGVRILEA